MSQVCGILYKYESHHVGATRTKPRDVNSLFRLEHCLFNFTALYLARTSVHVDYTIHVCT